ncbi:MAG: hypothetical protein AB8B91_25120 [Rubripirellula sp.]
MTIATIEGTIGGAYLLRSRHLSPRDVAMWPNLKTCTLPCAFLLAFAGNFSNAQESIPLPQAQIDPHAANPFSDDQGLANPDHARQPDSEIETDLGYPSKQNPRIVVPSTQPSFDPPRNHQSGVDSEHRPGFSLIAPGTLDRLHSPMLRQDLQINGAQSCATSNCHGGPRPGMSQPWARRGSEYQIWVENDPHMQSWRTLCSDESVAIMQRLNIMEGDQIVDQAGFDNCLACHNSTKRYNEPRQQKQQHHLSINHFGSHTESHHSPVETARSIHRLISTRSGSQRSSLPSDTNGFLREGVGCSSCHGPSELWINTHFQQHWSPQGATGVGFIEAGDLHVRARMCAACHVGDKDRDMNHDIIAAGHPTLRYELATFHAWQPKHWRDAEANDKTYYEPQLWLAGQIAATDASLSLLHARTADAHTVSEWPEFAAFNCASCHHNLGINNDRKPFDKNRQSTASYSQWNDAGLRWLVNYRIENGQGSSEDFRLISALDAVRDAMEARPKPNPETVGNAVIEARSAIATWFDGQPGMEERSMFRSDRLAQVIVSAAGKRDTFRTWESAVQFYLAAVAARESWPGGWSGPLRNVADQLQNGLRYPDMIDISRYAKRDGAGPVLNRVETTRLGVEMAGWLGPVQLEPLFEEDDETITQRMRQELEQLIQQMEARLEELAEARAKIDANEQAEKKDDNEKKDADTTNRADEKKPELEEKSREDLKKQLEEQLKALEARNNTSPQEDKQDETLGS